MKFHQSLQVGRRLNPRNDVGLPANCQSSDHFNVFLRHGHLCSVNPGTNACIFFTMGEHTLWFHISAVLVDPHESRKAVSVVSATTSEGVSYPPERHDCQAATVIRIIFRNEVCQSVEEEGVQRSHRRRISQHSNMFQGFDIICRCFIILRVT